MRTDADVLIIGAGPAGLSLARTLQKETALRVLVLERAPEQAVAAPKPDGRDLALSLEAQDILRELGVWQFLAQDAISPLHEARITNGTSAYFLDFSLGHEGRGASSPIGHFVANQAVRQALWDAIQKDKASRAAITFRFNAEVERIGQGGEAGTVFLKDGKVLRAALVVAADSRFSQMRDSVGIPTHRLDFARTCLVARMAHEYAHEHVAYECFKGEATLAVLPLNGQKCSVVLTLPPQKAQEALAAPSDAFSDFIAETFQHRLGKMELVGERHRYPLVATYASRFYGDRFALVGDAAVGMHPVTAHGYNFGLKGAWKLGLALKEAAGLGLDLGNKSLLRTYSRAHRRATLPLFLATNAIVQLYASSHPAVRRVQNTLLHLGKRIIPARHLVVRHLTRRLKA